MHYDMQPNHPAANLVYTVKKKKKKLSSIYTCTLLDENIEHLVSFCHENLIDKTTSPPYFTRTSCKHADLTHFHHGFSKVASKSWSMRAHLQFHVGFCLRVVKKCGIRLEQASSLSHNGVVVFVEGLEASWIHLNNGGGISRRTLSFQLKRIVWIQCRVCVAFAGEVVQTGCERRAVRYPNSVSS